MVLNGFERLSMVGIGLHFPADLLMNQIENLHVYLCILVRLRSNPAVWKSVGKTKNIEILIYMYNTVLVRQNVNCIVESQNVDLLKKITLIVPGLTSTSTFEIRRKYLTICITTDNSSVPVPGTYKMHNHRI